MLGLEALRALTPPPTLLQGDWPPGTVRDKCHETFPPAAPKRPPSDRESPTQDRSTWICMCHPLAARPGPQDSADGPRPGYSGACPCTGPCPRRLLASHCSAGRYLRIQPFAPKHPPREQRRHTAETVRAEAVKEAGAGWCSQLYFRGGARSPCWPFPQAPRPRPQPRPHPHKSSALWPPYQTTRHTRRRHRPSPSRRLRAVGLSCWHFYVTSTLFTIPLFPRGRGKGGWAAGSGVSGGVIATGGSWAPPTTAGEQSVRQRVVQRKHRGEAGHTGAVSTNETSSCLLAPRARQPCASSHPQLGARAVYGAKLCSVPCTGSGGGSGGKEGLALITALAIAGSTWRSGLQAP